MLTINLDVSLKRASGDEVEDSNMAKIVSNQLVSLTKGEPLKYWLWAQSLWKKGTVQLDKPDFVKLQEVVESSDSLTILAKAQILERLEEQLKLHLQEQPKLAAVE